MTTRTPDIYFIRLADELMGSTPWRQCTKEEFIRCERAAGFYPKGGGRDSVATGGFFGSNGREGRVVSPDYTTPESYDWDPEFQAVLVEVMSSHD